VAAILFIIKYSRINVVKYVLSGRSYRSTVNRAATHRWLLNQTGEQLQVLKLQGFLFFGTANNLLAQVRKRAEDPELVPLRYVVFDFRHVSGLDSSALNSLGRMKQLAESREITLVFTHLSSSLQSQFERGGFPRDGDGAYKFFPDLDHGVEWCEDLILGSEMKALQEKKDGHLREHTDVIFESTFDEMMETLKQQEDFERLVHRMKGYVETLTLDVHSCLIRQGEPVNGLYFVETGQVTAYIEHADGKKVRLRTLGMGSIVGELGVYGGTSATASVIATRESRIYYLSRDSLRQIEENDPEMAADLHKSIARLLGERLADATRTIEALLEH
ncbi:MAG: cyclic nucleotide-binding domain-containing protein, partial [Pseudomonadota bacterium]